MSLLPPQKNKNKNKLSKQVEQEQNHRNIDHMEGYQRVSGRGREREKVQGIRSIIGKRKRDKGRLRIVYRNGEAKELICTTHGHELKRGMLVGGGCRVEGDQRKKKMGQL